MRQCNYEHRRQGIIKKSLAKTAPTPNAEDRQRGVRTYLSFSCYLKDEGHERDDRGGGNDEADPSGLLCQPHPLLPGIQSPGVERRPRPGQKSLDAATTAALLGCHFFVSLEN